MGCHILIFFLLSLTLSSVFVFFTLCLRPSGLWRCLLTQGESKLQPALSGPLYQQGRCLKYKTEKNRMNGVCVDKKEKKK